MKHPRLSAIFVAVSAASLLMVSTAGFAAHKSSAKPAEAYHNDHNDRNDNDFKGEVPPPCPPVMVLHDGFYIGAGVGYDSYRINHNSDFSEQETGDDIETISFSTNKSATGWMGGIFAGYGRYFDWFYLAAEINANASNADSSLNYSNSAGNSTSVDVEARTSYGIALLPGVKLNDSSLFYIRLGYLRTDFKARVDNVDHDFIDNVDSSFSGSRSEWRNGFQYGVGIETAIACDVSIRGEFTHTSYNSNTVSGSFVEPATNDSFSFDDKFNVSNNEFMLSLLYHFV